MTMQRRHFELIAESLHASRPIGQPGDIRFNTWKSVVSEFCGRLSATNPNFNRARFLRACGVED